MIFHIIRLSIKPGVSQEQVQEALTRMQEAGAQVSSANTGLFGRDVGGEYDFAAVSSYPDLASYEEMMNHPSHLAIDRLGLPLVDKFMSFDVTDDPDPQIAAKIADVHRRRYEAMPDIAELVSQIEYSGSAAPIKA